MQKIVIKNFGPIEFAEIDISRIVVLIGEQASGKSTIGKLIYFFKSLKEEFFSFIYKEDVEKQPIIFYYKIREKFKLFFPFFSDLNFFTVKYFYSKTNFIELVKVTNKTELTIENSLFTETNRQILEEIITKIHSKKTSNNIFALNEQKAEKSKGTNTLIKFIEDFFQDNLTSLYVPAGRNISVTYSGQFKLLFFGELSKQFDKLLENINDDNYSKEFSADMFLMKEYLKEVEGVLDYFKNSDFKSQIERKKLLDKKINENLLYYTKSLIEHILKGEYVKDNSGEKIYYDKKNNGYVHLHNASSGQQEAIRILQDLFIILLDKKNVFRVIEEPEAHLYPVAQKNIVEFIATVINNTNSQIVITTHSPYILSVFNNLLYSNMVAKKDKTKTTKINEIIPEFSQLNPEKFRAYSLKNISKTYIDDNLPYCQSIFDKDTGLISQNYLDEVSEELGDEFDELYNFHKESIK